MSEIQKQSELKLVSIGNDAQYINQQIDLGNQAFGKSLEHYRNAGERLALVRDDLAKGKKIKGIGFQAWVKTNCNCERTIVYRYITLWENWSQIVALMQQSGDIFTLVDALKAIKDIKSKSLESDDQYADAVGVRIEEANADIDAKKAKLTTESKEIEQLRIEAQEIRFRAEQLEREAEAKADRIYNEALDKAVEDANKVLENIKADEERIKLRAKQLLQDANDKASKLPKLQADKIIAEAKLKAENIKKEVELQTC